jgi:hypothetical protein
LRSARALQLQRNVCIVSGAHGASLMHHASGVDMDAAFPPIEFFYSHLHDSIRGELQTLSNAVLDLENCDNLVEQLWHLKERYRFLGQVYKNHSSVEDEVGRPPLGALAVLCSLLLPTGRPGCGVAQG